MTKKISLILLVCWLVPPSIVCSQLLTGTCGKNLQWSYDSIAKHLNITGSGEMDLYKYPAWTNKQLTICSLSLSDSLTSIDDYAFEEQVLTSVIVPASVKYFGKHAFAHNNQLTHFEYLGDSAQANDASLYNCRSLRYFRGHMRMWAYCDAIDTVIISNGYACESYTLPTYIDNTHAYTTRLTGKYSTQPKAVQTLFLPKDLETINAFALCYAVDLGGITIPEHVSTIGNGAFLHCTSLDSLVCLGQTLSTIGDSAFAHCTGLSYIRMATIVPPTLAPNTFQGVDKSIPVYVPSGAGEAYRMAPYWSDFFHIIEDSPATSLREVISSFQQQSTDNGCYDILGRPVNQSTTHSIHIQQGKKTIVVEY